MGLGRSEVVIKFTQIYSPIPFKINYQWLFMSWVFPWKSLKMAKLMSFLGSSHHPRPSVNASLPGVARPRGPARWCSCAAGCRACGSAECLVKSGENIEISCGIWLGWVGLKCISWDSLWFPMFGPRRYDIWVGLNCVSWDILWISMNQFMVVSNVWTQNQETAA